MKFILKKKSNINNQPKTQNQLYTLIELLPKI